MRARRLGTMAVVALGLVALCFPSQSISGTLGHTPWVGLAGGRLGEYQWSVKVKRPAGRAGAGPEGALRPCLLVGTKWALGPAGYSRSQYRACTGARGRLRADEAPLVRSSSLEGGSHPGITVVGLVASPAVRRVQVAVGEGEWRTFRLDRLSPSQAQGARLGRLGYAAFAVRGVLCTDRIITLGAGGRPLWDSGTDEYSCAPEG